MRSIALTWYLIALTACHGGGEGEGGRSRSNTIMTVTESTPFDGARGVARSLSPEIFFSADIDPNTVNAASVTLHDGSGNVSTIVSVTDSRATVRPIAPLKPFTDYTLTVSERIRGRTGEVLAASVVIGFSTSDIAWDVPAQFPHPVTDIAMDSGGNVLAVWRQTDGIGASQYVVGTGWSARVSISGSVSSIDPQIEVDSAGNAIAFWTQSVSGKSVVWVSRYVAGGGWGVATTISDPTVHATAARIAFDATGNAIAVWQQSASSNSAAPSNVVANFYSYGVGWGAATPIQTDTSLNGKSPAVAVDGNGNAIIVWIESASSSANNNARDSRYVVGTGARFSETPLPLAAYPFTNNGGQVQVDDAGNAIFLWPSGSVLGAIYPVASHYFVATGWEAGVAIGDFGGGSARLAVNAAGDALAAWTKPGASGRNLWSNRYTVGTGWATEVQLSDVATLFMNGDGYEVGLPQIVIDAAGNGVAVWQETPDGPMTLEGPGPRFIVSNRYVAGSGWGTRTEMDVDSTKTAGAPLVAANADGDAFMMWRRGDGSLYTRKLD
jgi:hypothetical protein